MRSTGFVVISGRLGDYLLLYLTEDDPSYRKAQFAEHKHLNDDGKGERKYYRQ